MAFFHYPNGKLTQTAKKMVSAERRKESQSKTTRARHFHCFISLKIRNKNKTIHKIESTKNSYRAAVKANESLRLPFMSPWENCSN